MEKVSMFQSKKKQTLNKVQKSQDQILHTNSNLAR